jgi:3-hydroxyisobutyrate dehydrogenase-like beta-hydroxyacid dehydrogenase
MQIGFIGLGTMGTPMAMNLVRAGYAVRVWNRSQDRVSSLTALGATAASTLEELADGIDVLISMLADDAAVDAVINGANTLEKLKPGAIHVNMATVSAAFSREMDRLHRTHHVSYIAAPVLGRVNVAEAGKLNILAAGDQKALDRVQPLFDVMGQKTWRFGDKPEHASVVKLAANFMIASAIETMSEASCLVRGHGVSAAEFLEMMTSSVFAVPAYRGYGEAIANERFEPAGFKLALGAKDVRLALEAAQEANVPLPIGGILQNNHLDSQAHGEGHLDWAALSRVSARRSGQA